MTEQTDGTEPLIVAAIRRRPTGLLHHQPQDVGGTGTTAAGFLREYDDAIAAAEARGAQAVLAAVEAVVLDRRHDINRATRALAAARAAAAAAGGGA